jgi:hypothetical protein
MNTQKQFILMNAYDGDLMIGNLESDPSMTTEWVELKEYEGENLGTIDVDVELAKIHPNHPLNLYTTILAVARKHNPQPTANQLCTIGDKAARLYTELTGNKPEKISQAENGELILVNAYPKDYEPVLLNLIKEAIQVSYQESL